MNVRSHLRSEYKEIRVRDIGFLVVSHSQNKPQLPWPLVTWWIKALDKR